MNEKDLKKHKYDVFRLLQIVTVGTKVETMGLPFNRNQGVELLKGIYL